MKTIHKQQLAVGGGPQYFDLPKDFEFLTLEMQYEIPTFWYLFREDETETEEWVVYMYGTGWNNIPNEVTGCHHWGTVQDGAYIWHFFGEREKK